jgi:hypothetical protein
LKGKADDSNTNWSSYRESPSFGRDADSSWRLAHGAWADAVFLQKVKKKQTDSCTWCPGTTGTAWHIIFECIKVKCLWRKITAAIRTLTGLSTVLRLHVYAGFPMRKAESTDEIFKKGRSLVNYIITLAKSVIYREATLFFREKKQDVNYLLSFKKELMKRLQQEKNYHLACGNIGYFINAWSFKDFFISSTGELNLKCPLLK